jgi:hypothetical protein
VPAKTQLGRQHLITPDNLHRISNIISDAASERWTGENGNFNAGASPGAQDAKPQSRIWLAASHLRSSGAQEKYAGGGASEPI